MYEDTKIADFERRIERLISDLDYERVRVSDWMRIAETFKIKSESQARSIEEKDEYIKSLEHALQKKDKLPVDPAFLDKRLPKPAHFIDNEFSSVIYCKHSILLSSSCCHCDAELEKQKPSGKKEGE